MTRKEELRAMAARCWCDPRTSMIEMDTRLAEVFTETLLQVEREVWGRVAEHCHSMHNDGYTLNDVLGCGNEGDVITGASNDELRTIEKWARAQQQELT